MTITFTGSSDKSYVVRIIAPSGVYYDYMLSVTGGTLTFPLSEGSGAYSVTLYESRGGTKYAALLTAKLDAAVKDGFTAFLYPNYYVNYNGSSKAVKLAAYIVKDKVTALEKIAAVYYYVIGNIKYDTVLAENTQRFVRELCPRP